LLNEYDPNGATLIHYITAMNYHEMITLLHEYGADINILTKSGLSPIVIAAAKGYEKSVKRLMRLGAVFG
jgi:ankyrin repeat protein